MPHHEYKTISGTVTHIFGHRFVLRTGRGDVLADLTPKGIEQIALHPNDEVTIEGEMKPSELKVAKLTRGGTTVQVDHKHQRNDDHDPKVVVGAAEAAGFTVIGSPRRKPKHFELLGQRGSEFNELHIELNGHIRKSKPVARDNPKWSSELHDIT